MQSVATLNLYCGLSFKSIKRRVRDFWMTSVWVTDWLYWKLQRDHWNKS